MLGMLCSWHLPEVILLGLFASPFGHPDPLVIKHCFLLNDVSDIYQIFM